MNPAVVTTQERLQEVVDVYSKCEAFAWDVETIGDDRGIPVVNRVAWIQLATTGRCDVIPMGHPHGEFVSWERPFTPSGAKRVAAGNAPRESDYTKSQKLWIPQWTEAPEQLTPHEVFSALKPMFLNPNIEKVAFNLKFDAESIAKYIEGPPVGPFFDPMVASWLIDTRVTGKNGLEECLMRAFGYKMTKGVGKDISKHPFSAVAKYGFLDSKYLWVLYKYLKEQLTKHKLDDVMYDIEMPVTKVCVDMELEGALIDEEALKELGALTEADLDVARTDVYRAAGYVFNINSDDEVRRLLFGPKDEGGQGLTPKDKTAGGRTRQEAGEEETLKDFSVSADALAKLPPSNKLVQALLAYAKVEKIHSTYVLPYLGGTYLKTKGDKQVEEVKESLLINGRIHARFNQIGAETSRFSCVSGDTLLPTSRGVFRFDEYIPDVDDCVISHIGSERKVLRKIYKGEEEMFLVTLDNGNFLKCTMFHKVLTSFGWIPVRDLNVGDEVLSYVNVKEICQKCGEPRGCSSNIFEGRQAYDGGYSSASGNFPAQCDECFANEVDSGGVCGRESSSVLTLEAGRTEPYAGQEWFASSQLQGSYSGRTWIPTDQDFRVIHPVSQVPNVSSLGDRFARYDGSSSHRQGPDEQQLGQSGSCYEDRTSCDTHLLQRGCSNIVSIESLGTMGVWDIEVEGDHSYLAQGFFNHNSSQPNLQNVPNPRTTYGKKIRNLFVAPPGHCLVVADYSQIEPRIIASLSKDAVMLNTYKNKEDIYIAIGNLVGVDRAAGKILVLSMAYGIGAAAVAEDIGVSVKEGQRLLDTFFRKMPGVMKYQQQVISEARRRQPVPFVQTVFGHRRYLPELHSRVEWQRKSAERKAFNTMIQGTAAGVMKLAMIRADQMLPDEARMIITVHDELVITTPNDMVEETTTSLREAMEGVSLLTIPLVADIKVVDRWGEAK